MSDSRLIRAVSSSRNRCSIASKQYFAEGIFPVHNDQTRQRGRGQARMRICHHTTHETNTEQIVVHNRPRLLHALRRILHQKPCCYELRLPPRESRKVAPVRAKKEDFPRGHTDPPAEGGCARA